MSERIVRSGEGALCTLTIDRADKLNALDGQFFDELEAHAIALEAQAGSIGCVVLRASGRAFSAGADLGGVGVEKRDPRRNSAILERFANLPMPLVAAIHGICYTGGLEIALACDFLIAEESARFADTHGKWGFVPMWGMTQRLPRRIGVPAARRMMMTGLPIGAAEAKAIGLIDEVAAQGALDDAVAAFTSAILANSAFTNAQVKRMIRETEGMTLAQGLAYETFRWPGSAPDSRERIAKFTKK